MKHDADVLREIETKYGRVTADNVVDAAKDENHIWHERFDWNDETAAHKARLFTARALIRSVIYERRTETRVLRSVAYVRDPDAQPDEQAYVSVASLRTDEERARATLLQEFQRVASVLRRARELADVLNLSDEVETLLNQVEGLAGILRQPPHDAPTAHQ
jgi:hypothetical protein